MFVLHVVQELGRVIPVVDVPYRPLTGGVPRSAPTPLTSGGKSRGQPSSLPAHKASAVITGVGSPAGLIGVGHPFLVAGLIEVARAGLQDLAGILIPAMWPLRKANICQPKTDVSPGWPGE